MDMDKIFVDSDELSPGQEEFARLLEEEVTFDMSVTEADIVTGRVLEVTPDYVRVDIGWKSEGRIDVDEFKNESGIVPIKAGDEVEVYIETLENDEGQCVLSKREADRRRMWDEIETRVEAGETVEGTIIGRVKGGLQVDIGVKAFLPGSQVGLRPSRNLDQYIGEKFDFEIIKFNKKRGNIVLSRRTLLERARQDEKRKTLEKLKEGVVMDGVVKNITDYGAFVDLGGIDGLLHITDMSWGRISHPEEKVAISDNLRVKILKFNPENERVSLGLKQLTPDPWDGATDRYPAGAHVLGRVVSLIDYGAFVELEEGIEGLVHISEMSWTQRVKHPSRVVSKEEIIPCYVLKLDEPGKKISLGMKQLQPNPWTLLDDKYPVGTRIVGKIRNITDFGIFIGIEEGIDGLVHISDLSWTQKIKHPGELYSKGEEVEAVVLNIDVENERFSLGIKQLHEDPWQSLPERLPPGHITEAKITKVTDFGAFAEVEEGIEGLVHISELAIGHVDNPLDVVKPGETVKVEVIQVDPKEKKIALSIKSYLQRSEHGTLREYRDEGEESSGFGNIFKERLEGAGVASEEEESAEESLDEYEEEEEFDDEDDYDYDED